MRARIDSMQRRLTFVPAATIIVGGAGMWISDCDNAERRKPIDPVNAAIVECYSVAPLIASAFDTFTRSSDPNALTSVKRTMQAAARQVCEAGSPIEILITVLGRRVFGSVSRALQLPDPIESNSRFRKSLVIPLEGITRGLPLLARCAATVLEAHAPPPVRLSVSQFEARTHELVAAGYLNPAPQAGIFEGTGLLKPVCPFFGFSRGTPIDRYYLDEFLRSIRDTIVGRTLEIGATQSERHRYAYSKITDYLTVDVNPDSGPDVVADVHKRGAFEASSFDSIIAFNVLEHCERPWTVLENISKWLVPGGHLFCMVPCVQRVHAMPNDYWRPLPAGLRAMCRGLDIVQIDVHGNLLSSMGALSGVAAEEIGTSLLNERDNRYPVAACLVARRPINT